ncbi:MAG: dihydroneopterin aldolase [Flavobacteriales bacterium]
MNKLEINGIRLYAYHGCLDEEAAIGGDYEVDLAFYADLKTASETDDLNKTIDYVKINELVKEEMKKRSKLIEHVAKRILQRVKNEFDMLEKVEVKVKKINPPMHGSVDNVAVTFTG